MLFVLPITDFQVSKFKHGLNKKPTPAKLNCHYRDTSSDPWSETAVTLDIKLFQTLPKLRWYNTRKPWIFIEFCFRNQNVKITSCKLQSPVLRAETLIKLSFNFRGICIPFSMAVWQSSQLGETKTSVSRHVFQLLCNVFQLLNVLSSNGIYFECKVKHLMPCYFVTLWK